MVETRSRTRRAAAAILRYPARHIVWRIIAPYALLTLAFAGMGTYLTTSIVGSSLEDRFNNRLLDAGRVAADSFVLQERKHLEVGRAGAFTDGVAAATRERDVSTLVELITPIAANSGVDRLEIFGSDGSLVYGAARAGPAQGHYQSLQEDLDLASLPIVSRVLKGERDAAGDKFSSLIKAQSGYLLATAAPVYDGLDLVGAVLVGTSLDSLLLAIKNSALADLTLYAVDGTPLASSFAGGGLLSEADLRTSSYRDGGLQGATRETRRLFGRDYSLLYANLKVRGQSVGLYSVALSNDFVTSAGAITAWKMALFFGLGAMAVFAIGWTISHSLTDPILQLLKAARLVTQGDLTARAGIRKSDEIGALAGAFDTMTARLQHQHLATIRALTSAIDARDPYTLGHSVRVGQLATEIGRRLSLPEATLQKIEIGGYLHDIGKIGIRDAVLLKQGLLTPEQRKVVEEHPRIGLRILESVELPPEVIEFVGSHHERLDGSGYPFGLVASEIPVIPRIAAVADIYDALTSDRPYRPAMSWEAAMAVLWSQTKGGLLDPRIVDTMQSIVRVWEQRRRDDPALRSVVTLDERAA